MPSPYFTNVDPSPSKRQMFFGRHGTILAITECLMNGDSILLIGERRIGKTFLLQMLSSRDEEWKDTYERLLDRKTAELLARLRNVAVPTKWCYIDMLTVNSAHGLYFNILAGLSDDDPTQYIVLSPLDNEAFFRELKKLSDHFIDGGSRAVVLVDEAEKLLDLDKDGLISATIKAVLQQCPSVDFLLAGDLKPHQTTPQFANLRASLRSMYLGPLTDEEAQALITQPLQGQVDFEEAIVNRILELTGCRPGLIQVLCGHLFDALQIDDGFQRHLTGTDFDTIWETNLREKVFDSFEAALRDSYYGLQGAEYNVFAFLAHHPLSNPDDIARGLRLPLVSIRKALYSLRQQVVQSDRGYRVRGEIVEEFGSSFVICPNPVLSQEDVASHSGLGPVTNILRTNLKHHEQGIAALVEQWKGIKSQEDIEYWLLSFDDDERDIAIKILRNTRYYSRQEINKRLTALHDRFLRHTGLSPKQVLFFGVGGPSKSGSMLLYLYRTVNGLSESPFPERKHIPGCMARGIQALAFVDDFIGSGNQVTDFLKSELQDLYGIERLKLYCLALIASHRGMEQVQAQTGCQVICCDELDERDRIFSPSSVVFQNEDERRRAEDICRRHGEVLCPDFPLGYDDSQALVAFEYQTPNNSLPILWSSAKGWMPIFERKG